MKGRRKALRLVVGALLVIFGLLCLNYTREGNRQHHREWAVAHRMPPPSTPILVGGVVAIAAGAVLGGAGLVRGRRRSAGEAPR